MAGLPPTQTVVRMQRRAIGNIVPGEDLVAVSEATPKEAELQQGQLLLHRLFLSLDPAMRGWMRDIPSYIPPVQVGAVMRGATVNEVIASRDDRFAVGDIVTDQDPNGGWSEFSIASAKTAQKVPSALSKDLPLSAHLGVLGLTGLTAYFGLLRVGQPKEGETVMVSGAAGATGSVVCQIAKLKGCKVIGIAGGADKCAWLREEIGVDAAIDYKLAKNDPAEFQKLLRKGLKEAGSPGVDVFFDNVGGFILNETLRRLNMKGRIVICGAISSYNVEDIRGDVVAPTNYMALITLRAKMEGFVVFDFVKEYPKAISDLSQWIGEGKMKFKEDVRQGLQSAPEELLALFNGSNTGKLVVKVGDRLTLSAAASRL